MKNKLFKPEVEALLAKLEQISPKNVAVCKKSCRDDYETDLNAGKDRETSKTKFLNCIDKCLGTKLNDSDTKTKEEILSKLKEKL